MVSYILSRNVKPLMIFHYLSQDLNNNKVNNSNNYNNSNNNESNTKSEIIRE